MRLPRVRKGLSVLTKAGFAAHEAIRWLCGFGVAGLVLLAAAVVVDGPGLRWPVAMRESTG